MSNLRQTLAGLAADNSSLPFEVRGSCSGSRCRGRDKNVSGFVWAAFTAPVLLLLLFDIVMSLRRGEIDDARQPRTKHVRGFFVIS